MNTLTPSTLRLPIAASWLGGALLLAASTAQAAPMAQGLTSEVGYNEYSVSESILEQCREDDRCPEVAIKYLNTSAPWINTIVNQRVNSMVVNSGIRAEEPVTGNISKAKVQAAVDDFAKEQLATLPKDSSLSYELNVTPGYLGHIGQTELFVIDSYVYLGGAHGLPYREYLVFDSQNKRQITLNDMLLPKQASRFETLARSAYRDWVKTVADDVDSYEQSWPFSLSKNVTLTNTGITLLYQPYDIGPYAYGMPELHIPYTKLKGVVKPSYLPK
ncbi:RsiV family protein [Psychrobacter aestuarii]|uniref:RsiV family protein n=1 Tax=Psychrobacter aestuarii TaxID=556327 RepID=A0ABP3FCM5_9GAMM|nr:RsiV family protein [Psychrobacter aestuarii]